MTPPNLRTVWPVKPPFKPVLRFLLEWLNHGFMATKCYNITVLSTVSLGFLL